MSAVDVVIVGGGPAGLSAALILGRCRRRVLLCDAGEQRNKRSHAMHGFLSRDGIAPTEFLRIAHEQLQPYESVVVRSTSVRDLVRADDTFLATLEDGTTVRSAFALLATGVLDRVPDIPGLDALYGQSVFHCPYCDGWEVSGGPVAVWGRGKRGVGLALELTAWSDDIVLCSDGRARLAAADRERLHNAGVAVREERIARLEGEPGQSVRVVFRDGSVLERQALFFTNGQDQRCDLASRLGCRFNRKGTVSTGRYETTVVPGLYVAGDASHDVQLVVIAAAEGARAAFAINQALIKRSLAARGAAHPAARKATEP
jgi:thioredoxin reductase